MKPYHYAAATMRSSIAAKLDTYASIGANLDVSIFTLRQPHAVPLRRTLNQHPATPFTQPMPTGTVLPPPNPYQVLAQAGAATSVANTRRQRRSKPLS